MVKAGDATVVQDAGQFGTDPLQLDEVVGRAGSAGQFLMDLGIQHIAGDIAGCGGRLVGNPLAFPGRSRGAHVRAKRDAVRQPDILFRPKIEDDDNQSDYQADHENRPVDLQKFHSA